MHHQTHKEITTVSPTLTRLQKKSLAAPDEVQTPPKARVEIVKLGEHTLTRETLQPGWRWSRDAKPKAGTEWCEAGHLVHLLSGRMQIALSDGTELAIEPQDFVEIPPGHDGWVVGDEPAVILDFGGGPTYGKPA
jgi:hypothetical protein